MTICIKKTQFLPTYTVAVQLHKCKPTRTKVVAHLHKTYLKRQKYPETISHLPPLTPRLSLSIQFLIEPPLLPHHPHRRPRFSLHLRQNLRPRHRRNLGPGFDFFGCTIDGLGDFVSLTVDPKILPSEISISEISGDQISKKLNEPLDLLRLIRSWCLCW